MWKIEKIVRKGDYDYAIVRGHPNATKNGYVLHHRVIMENHLNRLLNSDEIIHHKNGDKRDNNLSNLEVMNNKEHCRLHGLEQGRNWVTLRCPMCLTVFDRERRMSHLVKKGKATFCSRQCAGKFWTTIGKTHEVDSAISVNIVREYRKYSHDNTEETN